MDLIDPSVFDHRLQCELEKVGLISCKRLMEMTDYEYQKLGNFSSCDIELIRSKVAEILLPTGFVTAIECEIMHSHKWKNLITDCSTLDAILDGGIPCRGITELSGESGVGKTQLCLQLSLTVQYPETFGGFNASAIYICTEDRFPSARLQQMLPHFPRLTHLKNSMKNHSFSDNILIDHIGDLDGLNACLFKRLPSYLANSPSKVGLVIVDSIAAIFRSEYTMSEIINRASDMRRVGLQLHKLADLYNVAVVCINQVTDLVDSGVTVPALGLAWANLVTTKLQISMSSQQEKVRSLKVLSAPHLATAAGHFQISDCGLETYPFVD